MAHTHKWEHVAAKKAIGREDTLPTKGDTFAQVGDLNYAETVGN